MSDVVILKQPLYGSVEWNGVEFIYTPYGDTSSNDSYIYRANGKIYTKYVNSENEPPVLTNPTITVDANHSVTVNISKLASDDTVQLGQLSIINIKSDIILGSVVTDGNNIYFTAGDFNKIELVEYTISDKEYSVTGVITFNIINGVDPETFKGSPYTRFARLIDQVRPIMLLSGALGGLQAFVETNADSWDSIDAVKYNNFSDVVSGNYETPNYKKWDNVFSNIRKYNALYSTVTSESGTWEDDVTRGTIIYNTLTGILIPQNTEYINITSNKDQWNTNITGTSSLSDGYIKLYDRLYTTQDTVSSNQYDKWDTNELNYISSNYFDVWKTLYQNVISDNYYIIWDKLVTNYNILYTSLNDINDKINDTYYTVIANPETWETNTLNTFSANNFYKWNTNNDILSSNYDKWNSIRTILTTFSANYFNNVSAFKSTYSTVTSTSGKWETNTLNTFSANNFYKWNTNNDILSSNYDKWDGTTTILSTFSANYFNNVSAFKSTYSTVTSTSGKWDRTVIETVSSKIPLWDDSYDILVGTDDNTTLWDNTYNLINGFSASYNDDVKLYDSTVATANSYNSVWNDKSISSILTSVSSSLINTYDLVCATSANWKFIVKDGLSNVYNNVTSQSANNNNTNSKVNTRSPYWNNTYTKLTAISSDALSGSLLTTLSTKSIYIYGDGYISGNLSALGKKITINTTIATTSGFSIENAGSTDAFTVNKLGNFDKAIVNFDTILDGVTSTVLYVKATSGVGVNLSAIGSFQGLVVFGDISASGYTYPLNNVVTVFSANSAKYTTTYNSVCSLSDNINNFKPISGNYNNLSNFYTLSNLNINSLTANKNKFDLLYTGVSSTSSKNSKTNDFIVASGSGFAVDTLYTQDKNKLDTFYSNITSISGIPKIYDINVVLAYNKRLSSNTVQYLVEDDITIDSWTLIADKLSIITVDILSSDYNTYGNSIKINNFNSPHMDELNTNFKNTSKALNSWSKNISKDSILQFVYNDFTTISSNSNYLLSLKVSKL